MANNLQPACPACEYTHGKPGRPVARLGKITCLDCGNSWKEFGTVAASCKSPIPRITTEVTSIDDRILRPGHASIASAENSKIAKGNYATSGRKIARIALIAASVASTSLLLIGLVGQLVLPDPNDTPLQIGQIELQEQINSRGDKVFTVRGHMTNSSTTGQKIPKISIVLRQVNGHEVYRWQHNSPSPILRGGGKASFASSVQHDNPLIAYAEAAFEN